MRLSPSALSLAKGSFYYLYGEDHDSLFDAAEQLLGTASDTVRLLRLDVDEIDCIDNEIRHDGLFGQNQCHVLVRNAERASPKQAEKLIGFASRKQETAKIVICAAGVDARKSWHKRLLAEEGVGHCRFNTPSPEAFRSWLNTQLKQSELVLTNESETLLLEHLQGKRQAAKSAIERLHLYNNGCKEALDVDVVGALLGERVSEDIGIYCHHVACRSAASLSTLHRLLNDQLISEVQVLGWLQTRFTQLLLYKWHASKDPKTAILKAKIFFSNRQQIQEEARHWSGKELVLALGKIAGSEKLLKGASIESKQVVLKHLTRDLLLLGK